MRHNDCEAIPKSDVSNSRVVTPAYTLFRSHAVIQQEVVVRYSGLLVLAMLVGCVESTRPVSQPTDVDGLPGAPPHTVNKPITDADPMPIPAFNRGADEAATRRDNTAVNERDNNAAAKTPFDQGNNTRDIKLTADIRQQIVNRSGMSINARNIKIVAAEGKVTLRGPVDNQAEKDLIDQMAKDTAGAANVDNQLEVLPAAKSE